MALDKKTAAKTAVSPLSGGVIPLGAHPGNTGGKRGRSGRYPKGYKAFNRKLLHDPRHYAAVETILTDAAHKHFATEHKTALELEFGKASQQHEITGNVTVKVLYDDD